MGGRIQGVGGLLHWEFIHPSIPQLLSLKWLKFELRMRVQSVRPSYLGLTLGNLSLLAWELQLIHQQFFCVLSSSRCCGRTTSQQFFWAGTRNAWKPHKSVLHLLLEYCVTLEFFFLPRCQSISSSAEYRENIYISHPIFTYVIFCNPIHITETLTANRWGNH